MPTVLLTAIGSAAAHAAHTALTAAGCRVLGCDIYPRAWNVNAIEMEPFLNVPPATDAEAYTAALLDAVRAYGIEAVIPLTDVEVDVLCTRKPAFAALGATVCCPEPVVADLCRNKLRMAQSLAAAGLCDVIPTWTRETLPAEPPYPLLLKPLRGRSSQAQQVVDDAQALALALSQRADYILQPYWPGDVYTVDCARDAHGNMVTLTRRERLRTVNGLGTAVDICPAHPLDGVCRGILAHVGLLGVVNMEFIRRGDTYRFLEINPRFSGGVGFSLLAGYDFVNAMLRCHAGLSLVPPPVFMPMTLAQRYEMCITRQGGEDQ